MEVEGKTGVAIGKCLVCCLRPGLFPILSHSSVVSSNPNDVQSRHSLFFDENTGGPLGGFGTNATLKQTDIGSAYNQTFTSCVFSYHDDLLVVDGGVGLELEDFTPTLTVD